MRIQHKLVASVAFLTIGAQSISLQTNPMNEELISDNMSGVDFMEYYNSLEGFEDEDFVVENVLMRRDANFMQGFYYDITKHQFVESAGLYEISKVEWLTEADGDKRVEEADPGVHIYELDSTQFGEGLSPLNEDEFIVLTWHERAMLILDRNTLEYKREYVMPSEIKEGWGVTADENNKSSQGNYRLWISDGTSKIFELDGDTMKILHTRVVKDQNGNEVDEINELEYVGDKIYANIWYQNDIVMINPETGVIEDKWDISSLAAAERAFQMDTKNYSSQDCLNGIAYNSENGHFYLTGKKHHLIFEVTLK